MINPNSLFFQKNLFKMINTILLLFLTNICFSQDIGKFTQDSLLGRCSYFKIYKRKGFNKYSFEYSNQANTQVNEKHKIFFEADSLTFKNLYIFLSSPFTDKNKDNEDFTNSFILGNTKINLMVSSLSNVEKKVILNFGDGNGWTYYQSWGMENAMIFVTHRNFDR